MSDVEAIIVLADVMPKSLWQMLLPFKYVDCVADWKSQW